MSGESELTPLPKMRQVIYSATFAGLPVTNLTPGDLAYADDTKRLYRWNGAAWQPITPDPATFALCSSGSYAGDSSVNRAIPHGLGVIPALIVLSTSNLNGFFFIIGALAYIHYENGATQASPAVTAPGATNFYVGEAGDYTQSANLNTITYYWVAFS